MRVWMAVVLGLMGAVSIASAPRAQTPPAAPSDPAFDAAKRAFDALPEIDRRAIQDALIWTGDYKGVVDGGFGRGTRAAMVAYARRAGLPDDGAIDAKVRAALVATATAAKAAAGFASVHDTRSGVTLSLPLKTLIKRTDTKTGSRWTSADGLVSVETSQSNESDADLPSLFDKLKDSTPARKVTYKLLKPDFLVVSGEAGKTAYYTRLARGAAGGVNVLRGYNISYPLGAKALENISVAVANSFYPFAGSTTVAPVATAPAPSAAAAPAPPPPSAPPIARPTIVASAVAIGPDRAMSVVGACVNPTIAGRAARIVKRDDASGLALFEASGLGGRPLATPTMQADAGAPLIVLFQSSTGATASRLVAASGEALARGARILAPLEDTSIGGAIFDRKGALLGVIGARAAPVRVAGVVPQTAWPVVPSSTLSAFLAPATVTGSPLPDGSTAADIVARAGAAILPLSCDR